MRLDEAVGAVSHAGAQEDDAVIGFCGMDDDAGGSGGMDPAATDFNAISDRLLKTVPHFPFDAPVCPSFSTARVS